MKHFRNVLRQALVRVQVALGFWAPGFIGSLSASEPTDSKKLQPGTCNLFDQWLHKGCETTVTTAPTLALRRRLRISGRCKSKRLEAHGF